MSPRSGDGAVYDLVIRGGRVALPGCDRPVEAEVGVRAGRVAAIGMTLAPLAAEVIDAHGLWVLPGLIDIHVHFRDPGMTYKDTFLDGTRASAFGGATTVFDMPNTRPPVISAEAFQRKLEVDDAGGLRAMGRRPSVHRVSDTAGARSWRPQDLPHNVGDPDRGLLQRPLYR